MKCPEVSVIIPCYNVEKYILSALHSLEIQIFRNFDVIIVNDGSTDNSEIRIKEYINSGNGLEIQYFYQDNCGVSVARNIGMQHARGKYITFLDADDLYHPQFLQRLFQCMCEEDVDIACCKYQRIKEIQQFNNEKQQFYNKERVDREDILKKYLHKRKTKLNFFNAIYKKKIISEQKILFPTHIKIGEDSEFFCQYLAHCNNGGILIDDKLYGYVNRPFSATNSVPTWRRIDNVIAMENIIQYWKKQNLDIRFSEYMMARVLWAETKNFSKSANKEFIQRLEREYDIRKAMYIMAKSGDELSIRISAVLYLISKKMFYFFVSKIG